MTVRIDSGPPPKMHWQTREQWARQRRSTYFDWESPPFADKFGHRASDYTTAEEIATIIAALKELWRQLGRKLREAKQLAVPLNKQPGETETAHWRRVR